MCDQDKPKCKDDKSDSVFVIGHTGDLVDFVGCVGIFAFGKFLFTFMRNK